MTYAWTGLKPHHGRISERRIFCRSGRLGLSLRKRRLPFEPARFRSLERLLPGGPEPHRVPAFLRIPDSLYSLFCRTPLPRVYDP